MHALPFRHKLDLVVLLHAYYAYNPRRRGEARASCARRRLLCHLPATTPATWSRPIVTRTWGSAKRNSQVAEKAGLRSQQR